MSEAPPFWFRAPGFAAWALAPVGWLYGRAAARRMAAKPRHTSPLPVLCVGNFVVGGAGKTPTALALAHIAREMDLSVAFLTRGYGGSITRPTLVDKAVHNARDVGDEPLLLALHAPTVVSPDRPAGARFIEAMEGVDLIIMDDGLQNPGLHRDTVIGVVDARRGFGNGFPMPAGPLRATLKPQLAATTHILLIGRSKAGTDAVRHGARMAKPVLEATTRVVENHGLEGVRALAFSGIADPEKFHLSLAQAGVEVVERRDFDDHHMFSALDCDELLEQARVHGLQLVTTQKDWARLVRMGEKQEALRDATKTLTIELEFENPKMAQMLIRDTVRRAEKRRGRGVASS